MNQLGGAALERSSQGAILGRIGSELAIVYDDMLQAPLPPALQALIDRLSETRAGRPEGTERFRG